MNPDYIPCPHCRTVALWWVTLDWGVRVLRCPTCGYTQNVPARTTREAVKDVERVAAKLRAKGIGS